MNKLHILFYAGLLISRIILADIDDRLDDLERKMRQVSFDTPEATIGATFSSGQPDVYTAKEQVYLTFNLLYWHPKVGGTEYAYSFQPNILPAENSILPEINGHIKDQSLRWNWGIKVGLGYNFCDNTCDLSGRYTWYATNATSSSTKNPPSSLLPSRLFTTMLASKVKSHFDLDYHTLDARLGKSFFISQMLLFHPYIGIQTTWLDLDQNIVYTASHLNDLLFPGPNKTTGLDFKSKNSSRFWGIGPQISIHSQWFLGDGFSFLYTVTGSILYGYFTTNHFECIPPNETVNTYGTIIKKYSSFHRFIPFTQMYLGIGWQTYINHDRQHITVKLGYEIQYYWQGNQMHQKDNFFDPTASFLKPLHHKQLSQDVMLYGVTGECKLNF